MNNQIEKMADNAMRASQGGGQSKMLQYMLARLAQQKTPARSNKEGIGRVLGTFLLPMIAQGAQTWKENYDARGDFKANGAELLKKIAAGETLDPQQQAMIDNYKSRYPKEYAAALAAAQQSGQPIAPQTAPQQPAPQGAQAPAPANSVDTSAIRQYIQQQLPQFENPADAPGNALTGAALAQEAEDRLREALGGEPKGWLLNALSYGR